MREIALSRGKTALVDDDFYEYLNRWKWLCMPGSKNSQGYAARRVMVDGVRKWKYMHRELTNPGRGMTTDHINGNSLDNRLQNLRVCTPKQNRQNNRIPCNNKSGYKGVYWLKTHKAYQAQIRVDGKAIFLGNFKDKIKAAEAYNEAAHKYFGEYAGVNIL